MSEFLYDITIGLVASSIWEAIVYAYNYFKKNHLSFLGHDHKTSENLLSNYTQPIYSNVQVDLKKIIF
jgi:hypothetical protein